MKEGAKTKFCSRCESRIPDGVEKCIRCGGEPTSSQKGAKENSKAKNFKEKSLNKRKHRSKPLDPELSKARERLKSVELEVADSERYQETLKRDLASALGTLKADFEAFLRDENKKIELRRSKLNADKTALASQLADLELKTKQSYDDQRGVLIERLLKDQSSSKSQSVLEPSSITSESQLLGVTKLAKYVELGKINSDVFEDRMIGTKMYLPLINEGSLIIDAPARSPGLDETIRNVVAQAFLSAPAGQLVVTVFNPALSKVLSAFQVQGAIESNIFSIVNQPTQQGLSNTLNEHLGHIGAVDQSMAGKYQTLADLVSATGQHEHQYHLLVILDAPQQWNADILDSVRRILSQGSSRGVSLLVHIDSSIKSANGLSLEGLFSLAPLLVCNSEEWKICVPSLNKKFSLTPRPDLSVDVISGTLEIIGAAATKGTLPSVSLVGVLGTPGQNSQDGLEIQLGRKGTQLIRFALGDNKTSLHNVLIGGSVGSGKTNLLKTLIYSLASQYSPDELRLFLLDFKQGVEFQRFADRPEDGVSALPHAEVVSMESDVEFGIAALLHFVDEIKRRGDIFKESGSQVQSISDFRRITGKTLPRWVLIIDEFQYMFTEEHGEQVTVLLEKIVRQGRSFGLHVILASQSLKGVRFSGGKGDAILGQFPVRLVLSMTREDSTDFLGVGNYAAMGLRYRGQAILNTTRGDPEKNEQFVVAFAEEKYLDQLQRDLALKFRRATKLHVNKGQSGVSLKELSSCIVPMKEDHEVQAWIGQRCTISLEVFALTLDYRSNEHLLILGPQLDIAIATLQTAALSAAKSFGNKLRILILDGLAEKRGKKPDLQPWLAELARSGTPPEVFAHTDFGGFSEECRSAAANGERTLAIILSGDSGEITRHDDYDDWMERIVPDLGRQGVHLIVQFTDMASGKLRRTVERNFRYVVFAGSPTREIMEVSNRHIEREIPKPDSNRIVFLDRLNNEAPLSRIRSITPLGTDDLANG